MITRPENHPVDDALSTETNIVKKKARVDF
jgi:hypothetical protein